MMTKIIGTNQNIDKKKDGYYCKKDNSRLKQSKIEGKRGKILMECPARGCPTTTVISTDMGF